ncbi:hypothetical protein [Corynebacterium sp.]|uniref:hypothetical protein n=1 Tax=Corynebacterium sp. TaxID=1720 RepID=UPI000A6947FB
MAETKLDADRNEASWVTEVMTDPLMNHDVDGVPLGEEESDGVNKLQLPTLAESNTAESTKNRAVQKAATGSHQIRRRIPNRRLSNMPTTFLTRSSSVTSTSKTP